ncbi:ABC transporter ATP-binding protein/permease [Roseomonas hellenica]|uniref:ABC transporter ATP-binding protein/permease n=1 Tax=Plastoroseomonas hellenica TaxID=2687306 RepID=A0ABS5EUK9_9PROT|nr:ABC transporter ATP-binding protein/permease [Plastoroseomonas hellenica]MBR0663970.1 ABC transporter ATP-binding protein/permease [Plastoroseomonas hellenica]
MIRRLLPFLRDVWAIAGPFWRSEERWRARMLLAVVVALNLALVGMSVLLTYWQNTFYNVLEARNSDAFLDLLFRWHEDPQSGRTLPGFVYIATAYVLTAVYALYLRQALQIRWRRWITENLIAGWLNDRAHYRIGLTEAGTDNPDQRIADDARLFVDDTLILGLGLMNAVVTLGSFVIVLWTLSGPVTLFGASIPGYMVWVALLYSLIGTGLAHWIGRPLIRLNFLQQRVEADFRFALVRLRENGEGIALHAGEADEHRALSGRFRALVENWWSIMVATKRLTFFTAGFNQVAIIFPIAVAAPAYFAGRMSLGGLIQTSSAFESVQGSLSWFVSNYSNVTEWRATVDRLTGFRAAIDRAAATGGGLARSEAANDALALDGATLSLPDGRVLARDAALTLAPGERVLVQGPSGAGKSTLFRAIAGIWPFAEGRLALPPGKRLLFLPQRPYIPLGSLRRAVCYPEDAARFTDAEVAEVLSDAGLAALIPRLDEEDNWAKRLSGGEQQRLALARALLVKPDFLFLDEATASLDPASEAALHQVLKERLPQTAILSIAHRESVARFHDRTLRFAEGRLAPA